MNKSLKKALDILFFLSLNPEQPTPLGVIAKQLGIDKSTASHLLETLCDFLMVERVSRREGYKLGAGVYMLTRNGRYQESLVEICTPVLKWLNRVTDASVVISIICDGVKYIVLHIDKAQCLQQNGYRIKQGTVDNTATGRLLMAYMNPDRLERTFERFAMNGHPISEKEREKLIAQFPEIRRTNRNYYYNADEGNHSYAFPINDGASVVAAIGVYFHDSENTLEFRENAIRKTAKAAREISRRLEFRNIEANKEKLNV